MRILVGLMITLTLAGAAFAENLQLGTTVGQGKTLITLAAMIDTRVLGVNEIGAKTSGVQCEYGINNKFDLLVSAGLYEPNPMPVDMEILGLGISAKYAFVEETSNMPAIAGLIGYKALNYYLSSFEQGAGCQTMVSMIASKTCAMFSPYMAIDYRAISLGSVDTNMTKIDATIGTAVSWSKAGSVFAEYTLQQTTPTDGSKSVYSSQIGFGVGYKI